MATNEPVGERAWTRLAQTQSTQPTELFDPATLTRLPAPAQRHLRRVLPPDTPLDQRVVLNMTGRIKLGPKWLQFEAEQILVAGVGFVWRPVIGPRLLRFTGADILDPGEARMEFRLHRRIPVVQATGDDIARSASGRLAAETAMWLPQALSPQAGATWSEIDGQRAVVTLPSELDLPKVQVTVDDDGRLLSTITQRWNAASKPPSSAPFGGPVRTEYNTASGVLIAGSGEGGWAWTTQDWQRGRFFDFTITHAHP